ncbi:MAG: uroporphyrinogen decarboxylase family protein [Bryobacteraceae bacterium]|nr:uroporphyrinogen decarboxylase family protein [Bryobacteraceae bacterium]
MNGYRRIAEALNGRWPDVRPVMLHNFMLAAREAGVTMGQYRSDPEVVARVHIQAVETYGYDGVLVDIDTATLAGAVGVPVDLPDDAPARCPRALLGSIAEVRGLPEPDVSRYPGIQVWLEAVRILKTHFRNEIFVRGNCDQLPFSLAGMMRGPADWLMDLMDPENRAPAHELLEYCSRAVAQFIRLMAAAGADMVSNGDSPAGPDLASPRLYREFAFEYERRIVDLAHELGLPYMLHICGKTDRILPEMVATGADALELDSKTGVRLARDTLAGKAAFVGNIDPNAVLALGSPRLVEERTRELLAIFADTPRFILNAGCAIPATTPPENLRAMIAAGRE